MPDERSSTPPGRAPGDQAFRVEGRARRFGTVKDRLKVVPGTRSAGRWARRLRREGAAVRTLLRDKAAERRGPTGGRPSDSGQAQVAAIDLGPLTARDTGESAGPETVASLVHVGPDETRRLLSPGFPVPDDAGMLVGGRRVLPGESAAGLLYAEGVGPRPYDAFESDGTAWLLEDFSREAATDAEVRRIHGAIGRLRAAGEVTCAPGWDAEELCRAAGQGSGRAVYCGLDHVTVADRAATVRRIVDDRARSDLHYGSEVAIRGGRYLYQTIPGIGAHGRRETTRRWDAITSMLARADDSLRMKVVLDVGCNAGMMLAAALSDGALWGLGWDRPEVVRHARRLLYGLGYTRFDLVGENLRHESSLMSSIPPLLRPALDGCVVLFLAIRHHLGFLPDLANVPWRLMLYEGGESERTATLDRSLEDLHRICAFDVVEAIDFRDGETASRPLALLVRRDDY